MENLIQRQNDEGPHAVSDSDIHQALSNLREARAASGVSVTSKTKAKPAPVNLEELFPSKPKDA